MKIVFIELDGHNLTWEVVEKFQLAFVVIRRGPSDGMLVGGRGLDLPRIL